MILSKEFFPRECFFPQLRVVSIRQPAEIKPRRSLPFYARTSSTSWEASSSNNFVRKIDDLPRVDDSTKNQRSIDTETSPSKLSELSFDKLQQSDKENNEGLRRAFGRFVAREAALDEEYWTASWLRAEAHWESMPHMRHVDNYKRKYAEQEFNALKRRCAGREGNSLKCVCIVSVKKEDPNIRRTVLNSVVGTLDLSIRLLLLGEKIPGENKRVCSIPAIHDTNRYAYISNVCVSKFARRQGIASNMLYLAIDVAASSGMKQLFVHVNADNTPAQELYRKVGFEVVDGTSAAPPDQRLLMCLKL
ncbi:GCN5-related N-acetyltransferase 6, chloroplastic-like [Wolffia australiana]